MIQHLLTPGDVDCNIEDICSQRSYKNCTRCQNNKVAVKEYEVEKSKEKRNYFRKIGKIYNSRQILPERPVRPPIPPTGGSSVNRSK